MKKTILSCFTGILLTWTMTSVSYSQSQNITAKPEYSQEKFISSAKEISAAKDLAPVVPGEISVKAVKNFTKSYKNVRDARWFKFENGFLVYFTNDDSKTKVYYNKRGNSEWMTRSYSEDKLPREIRHLVRSTYYDFSIAYVNEFTVNDIIAYVISLEDKTSWKTIKVVDGEIEVISEYLKS